MSHWITQDIEYTKKLLIIYCCICTEIWLFLDFPPSPPLKPAGKQVTTSIPSITNTYHSFHGIIAFIFFQLFKPGPRGEHQSCNQENNRLVQPHNTGLSKRNLQYFTHRKTTVMAFGQNLFLVSMPRKIRKEKHTSVTKVWSVGWKKKNSQYFFLTWYCKTGNRWSNSMACPAHR